jgi:hypothetical protein
MKLADFMHAHGLTPRDLREMLGVRSRTTVLRYISGERLPAPDVMRAIDELTGGAVTLADFLDPKPAHCLRVVVDRTGRLQEVYPWTDIEQRRRHQSANDNDPRGKRPSTPGAPQRGRAAPPAGGDNADEWPSAPLQRALIVLGGRAMVARRGGFLLDGRKADSRRVVAAANRVLKANGLSPIQYPGLESKR